MHIHCQIFISASVNDVFNIVLLLSTGGRGQKLLPTVVAAKVERFSIAFSLESGCFVHGHSTDGVFDHGFRFFHGHAPFLVDVVTVC
jgi:hypothetical protein